MYHEPPDHVKGHIRVFFRAADIARKYYPLLQPKAYAHPVDSARHARYNTSVGISLGISYRGLLSSRETPERIQQLNRYGAVGVRPGTQFAYGLACSVILVILITAEVEVTHDG